MVKRDVTLKEALCDGVFWSYSVLAVIYLLRDDLMRMDELRTLLTILAVLLVKLTILSLILQKVGQITISSFLFSKPPQSFLKSLPGLHLLATVLATFLVLAKAAGAMQ